jgi:hypothetical protein
MAGVATAGISPASILGSPGFGSVVNNGQLVGFQTKGAYAPINYGGGISAVPMASPVTIPPAVGYGQSSSAASYAMPSASIPGSADSTPNNSARGTYTGPFMGSPAMWGLGLIVIGLVWMRYVHWKK